MHRWYCRIYQIAEELAHSARFRANYIEKANFLRLSTLYLGYDLSSLSRKWTRNVVNGMRFSFAIQNVFVLTNYSGADPQVEGNGGNRKQRGIGSLSRDITNNSTSTHLHSNFKFHIIKRRR